MKRSDRLGMRVRKEDKEQWRRAARVTGVSLSAWIEAQLNYAAARANTRQRADSQVDYNGE